MMQNTRFKLSALAIATAMACSPAAFATNGYFVHGYGTKANGMGGVGVALPSGLSGGSDKSGRYVLDRESRAMSGISYSIRAVMPSLDATGLDGDGPGPYQGSASSADSGATLFLMPNAGFQMDMAGMTMGFAMYANGGMNTRYGTNIFTNAFARRRQFIQCYIRPNGWLCQRTGTTGNVPTATIDASLAQLYGNPNIGPSLGVNLSQLILPPSVSMKVGRTIRWVRHCSSDTSGFAPMDWGVSGMSIDPSNVTNKGDDDAWGAGVRLGWTGKLTDYLTLGATASSKIYMQKFERYKGLFAEGGKFDIPANYGMGLALKPSDQWTVAFDAERILYGDVKAIANPGPTGDEFWPLLPPHLVAALQAGVSHPLGTDGGYGFGWENQTIYKLGVSLPI